MSNDDTVSVSNPYLPLTRQAFSAASTNYRNAHRHVSIGDADLVSSSELLFIQARSKHLCRNNPIAASALDKFKTSLGAIKVVWKMKNGKNHKKMQSLWDSFSDNPSIDGKGNLDSFQATQNSDRFQTGESLARMLIHKGKEKIPMKLQGIESEYLDATFMGETLGQPYFSGRTRYGITFDNLMEVIPETYHFLPDRYYGMGNNANKLTRVGVPARDILHTFERIRSNQWRGIPLLASSMISLYELEDLCTATIHTQTSAAAITWIVQSGSNFSKAPLGVSSLKGAASITDPNQKLVFDATGGSVQYTNPGDIFQLVQSRDIGNNLIDMLKEEYQKIASAYNLPYYMLTGDMSGMNFSSIRAQLVGFRNRINYIYQMICLPDFMIPLTTRFKDISVVLGYKVEDAYPVFQYPRWYGVDDLKDAQADLLEIVSGMTPIEAIWAERGYTYEQIENSLTTIRGLGMEHLITGNAQKMAQAKNNEANPKSSSN